MILTYDPAHGEAFWEAIRRIPGYPEGETDRLIGPMLFESDALFKLPDVLHQLGADPAQPLRVVMDPTPMRRGKGSLKPLTLRILQEAGWKPEALVLKPDSSGQVRTDPKQISAVEASLHRKAGVISLGSGTVTDITKQACYGFEERTGHHLTYVACPTANSVGAYTSNVITVFIRGIKRSMTSRLPDALVYDLETLCDAPHTMTVAGAGEMLVCFVSFSDWLIAHRLGMDPSYSEFQQTLMEPLETIFVENAAQIREDTPEGMAIQARFIAAAGVGGSLLHASTPLSGYEHVISHLIDQQAGIIGRPLAFHGSQVILAALLVSEAYLRFLAAFEPHEVILERCYPAADIMKRRIETAFAALDPSGETAAECWDDYRIKLEAWHANRQAFARFLTGWPEVRRRIGRFLRPPDWVAGILAGIDSPLGFDELEPPVDEEQVKFAFMNAPFIRRRATLGDLLIFLDWDREALWDQVWSKTKTVVEEARHRRDRSQSRL